MSPRHESFLHPRASILSPSLTLTPSSFAPSFHDMEKQVSALSDPRSASTHYSNSTDDFNADATPLRDVCLPALAFAGVQLAWAVQIGHFTAHLRKLGLHERYVGLAWLGGPISGIVMQPVVGILSDHCTSRFGKRRPFMLVGSFFVAIFLTSFAWAGDIAGSFGDPVKSGGGGSRTGLIMALFSFWGLDFSINMLQVPTRALLADSVPPQHLAAGNSLFAVANGFGKAMGYVFGGYNANIRAVNGCAAFFVLLFALLPTIITQEPENGKPAESDATRGPWFAGVINNLKETSGSLNAMPLSLKRVFLVQWLSYLSFSATFIYISDFIAGPAVFGGNADAPTSSAAHKTYIQGVMYANKALLCMAVLSMLVAVAMPTLIRAVGLTNLWCFSLGSMGIALFSTLLTSNRIGVFFIVLSMAMPLAAAFSLPWVLAGLSMSGALAQQRGFYFAMFNLSQATPGIFSSLIGSLLVHFTNGRMSAPLAFGGAAGIAAAVATCWVNVPQEVLDRGQITKRPSAEKYSGDEKQNKSASTKNGQNATNC